MKNFTIKGVLVIILFLFFTGPSFSEKISPMDFAKGINIEVDNKASLYKFELPQSVYEGVTRKDLGDMRVFNSDDELVPFSIKSGKTSERKVRKPRKSINLPIFPLYRTYNKKNKNLSVKISSDKKGTIIDINNKSGVRKKTNIISYLVDLSSLKDKPAYLLFSWKGKKNLVTNIKVQAGNDLNTFSTIISKATLTDISFGKNKIHKNRVNLPYFNRKYLKIVWPAGASGVEITRITAHFPTTSYYRKLSGKKITLTPQRSDAETSDYKFKLKGFYPVDKIKISLPQKNTLVNYYLLAGDSYDSLRRVYSGKLYNLTIENSIIKNDDISISPNSSLFWLLRIDESAGGIGKKLPKITIEYHPKSIVFVARGEGPFKLAYGKLSLNSVYNQTDPVIETLIKSQKKSFVRLAKIGSEYILGGDKQLEAPKPPPKPFPIKKLILWIVLVFGVLIIAFMVFRLIKQMK